MRDYPKTAVVIVNWNRREAVLGLLNSLKDTFSQNEEVIVVDNASTDGSVEAIRLQFPEVQVITNSENKGGTAGFNAGIKYALRKGDFEYIWLLDNDAQVEENSFKELMKAMAGDETIGLAGSRIIDSVRKEITVEAGAFLRWDTIDVNPLFRNKKDFKPKTEIEDVDYVAICSALVRVRSLSKVGLMDERFFFFWDDMDWGLQFRKNGFRVVSVLHSIVYHPAFTEKRSPVIDYYYGSRNGLLAYSKHANYVRRALIFFNFLRFRSKVLLFWGMCGRPDLMLVGFRGIWDFITGAWGGRVQITNDEKKQGSLYRLPEEGKNILILNGGSRDEIFSTLNKLRESFPDSKLSLIMVDDRLDIYRDSFDDIIELNSQKKYGLLYNIVVFFKLLLKNYDIAVNPNYPSPFSFAAKRAYDFDPGNNRFIENQNSRKNIWKLIVSTLLGEAVGILLLPIVYVSSLRYKRS
ncbi:MAG TPA: glycosyltransferase family 2 protein [Thermodesulfobacteriota bacterium]|nr:glycosyltransferase family 2 protein [Thermodesulfobacteriota bacterium]